MVCANNPPTLPCLNSDISESDSFQPDHFTLGQVPQKTPKEELLGFAGARFLQA